YYRDQFCRTGIAQSGFLCGIDAFEQCLSYFIFYIVHQLPRLQTGTDGPQKINMEIIFLLIGISLVLAGGFLYLFFRAMKSGQYDDNYTPSVRILFDQKTQSRTNSTTSKKSKSKCQN